MANIVKLNVGGQLFITSRETLTKVSHSMLARMFDGDLASAKDEQGAVWIDRDPKHFALILNYLRDGRCVLPQPTDYAARQELMQEAEYYGLVGLVEELTSRAVVRYEQLLDQLLNTEQHKRATDLLWQVAFKEPLTIKHLTGSWIEITISKDLKLSGPGVEMSYSLDRDNNNVRETFEDMEYI